MSFNIVATFITVTLLGRAFALEGFVPDPEGPLVPPGGNDPTSEGVRNYVNGDFWFFIQQCRNIVERKKDPYFENWASWHLWEWGSLDDIKYQGHVSDSFQFAKHGSHDINKREIAAFLAQTSTQTAREGPIEECTIDKVGYFYVNSEIYRNNNDPCCTPGNPCGGGPEDECVCGAGQSYHGRGLMNITGNYDYGMMSKTAIGVGWYYMVVPHGLEGFTSALNSAMWVWERRRYGNNTLNMQEAIAGSGTPSERDLEGNRAIGFGLTTNLLTGGSECGKGYITEKEAQRIAFYERYCRLLGVDPGENLSCQCQQAYDNPSPLPDNCTGSSTFMVPDPEATMVRSSRLDDKTGFK